MIISKENTAVFECKVMIKAPLDRAEARLQECGELEFFPRKEWTLVEDPSGTQLFGWEVSSWVELAGDTELIYAYYDEDLSAEFLHIKDGVCLRAYLEYSGEVDTDEGADPETAVSGWTGVAGYLDKHMI